MVLVLSQNQNYIKTKTSKPKPMSKPKPSKPKPMSKPKPQNQNQCQNQNFKTKTSVKTKTQNQNFKTSFGFGACLAKRIEVECSNRQRSSNPRSFNPTQDPIGSYRILPTYRILSDYRVEEPNNGSESRIPANTHRYPAVGSSKHSYYGFQSISNRIRRPSLDFPCILHALL